MTKRITKIRMFTIADFEEEEKWLSEEHSKGWKLVKSYIIFYRFEKCKPTEVVYRLAYRNAKEDGDYLQFFADYGWEYVGNCIGWIYFRKPVSLLDADKENELYSDKESKVQMLQDVIKTRLWPVMLIFIACIIPQLLMALNEKGDVVILSTWTVLFLIYSVILTHVTIKLKRLKDKYKTGY